MAVFIASVTAAIADFTVATALAAIADIGIATTIVGAVTGDKSLMKIGGELGLVGGIGSFATSAFGAATDVATSAVSDAATNSGFAGIADQTAAETARLGGSAAADTTASTLADASGNAITSSVADPSGLSGVGADQTTSGLANVAPPTQTQTGAPTTVSDPTMAYPAAQDPMSSATGLSNLGDTVPPMGGDINGNGVLGNVMNKTPYNTAPGAGGGVGSFMDKLSAQWNSFTPTTKAELLKMGMAVPGGIQAQSNKERELALQQQKVNQTSYGSQVPTFGIIHNAAKGR